MATRFETPAELLKAVGRHLGTSDWLEITQDRIDKFAEATGDHQWIHVDPERAKAGPFGACIAHGYLTQSLVNLFLPQIVEVHGISMGVNYGADRVRFPAPVPVGLDKSPQERNNPAFFERFGGPPVTKLST